MYKFDISSSEVKPFFSFFPKSLLIRLLDNTYHIPICIWLMDTHPYNAPLGYVKPTSDMQIKVSMYVDYNGKIYLPYLHDWNPVSVIFFYLHSYHRLKMATMSINLSVLYTVNIGAIGSYSSDGCDIWRNATSICKTKGAKHTIPNTT